MITIRKLLSLPRRTRLRKIVRVLEQLERQSLEGPERPASDGDVRYVQALLGLLAEETMLSSRTRERARAAREALRREAGRRRGGWVRSLNSARHALAADLGQEASDWDFLQSGTDRLDPQRRIVRNFFVYLEDLRSPFNVGAIFRTADAFGIRRIYLSPDCPRPDHPRASRTSMGTTDVVEWAICSLEDALEGAASETGASPDDFALFALETGGTPLERFPFPQAGMAVLGSEELGVSAGALEFARRRAGCVSIGLAGAKSSLNVGVAFGILAYSWFNTIS